MPSLQQLENDVQRVVRLEDLLKLHQAAMRQVPHDLDLFYETLLAVLLAVGILLREGLDGVLELVFDFLDEVH